MLHDAMRAIDALARAHVLFATLVFRLRSAYARGYSFCSDHAISNLLLHHSPMSTTDWSRRRTLLQIGANDLHAGNDGDVRYAVVSGGVRAVLVEAHPLVFPRLAETVGAINRKESNDRLAALNVAVCPVGGESSSNATFWSVSPRFLRDFPSAPHWVRSELASLNERATRTSVEYFFNVYLKRPQRMRPDYIEAVNVPCANMQRIFELGQIEPEAVDIFVVDTEGLDAHVMLDALRVPGFAPLVIVFEQKVAARLSPRELEAVGLQLKGRNYTLHNHTQVSADRSVTLGDLVACSHKTRGVTLATGHISKR